MLIVDTNVLVRHLTGDPVDMAVRARRFLTEADDVHVPDIVLAEVVYVLESYYEAPRSSIATSLRAIIGAPNVATDNSRRMLRTIELYETFGHDFADAYLVASAEQHDCSVVTFDRRLGRGTDVVRIEP